MWVLYVIIICEYYMWVLYVIERNEVNAKFYTMNIYI